MFSDQLFMFLLFRKYILQELISQWHMILCVLAKLSNIIHYLSTIHLIVRVVMR